MLLINSPNGTSEGFLWTQVLNTHRLLEVKTTIKLLHGSLNILVQNPILYVFLGIRVNVNVKQNLSDSEFIMWLYN